MNKLRSKMRSSAKDKGSEPKDEGKNEKKSLPLSTASTSTTREHDHSEQRMQAPSDEATVSQIPTHTSGEAAAIEGTSEDSAACVSDAQITHKLELEDNAWTSAYRSAWRKRTEGEKRVLRGETLQSLFEQFNPRTNQNYNDSKLQKIIPFLEKMDHFLGAISPVAGDVNAIASNAFGAVQIFSTFFIAIAQAVPKVKEQMEKLIVGIPIVDRYARSHDTGALTKDGCLNEVQDVRSDIFPILCDLYSNLLDFYVRVVHLLRKGSVRNTAAVIWDDELTPLATSFEETWQRLDSLVQQENVFSNRFLIDEVLSEKVRTLLDVQREHESQNRILLKHRTDEACYWITKVPAFQNWLTVQGPESLALLAKLGFGKTLMIAYVVQYLKSGDDAPMPGTRSITAAGASQPCRNVYFYYCKDDGTANKALNVFRSLLSQLLKDHKHLCWHFNTWVQEQEKAGGDPTFDPSCLSNLLIALVATLPQPTFLIIDALDECLLDDRKALFDFLEQVCSGKTSTRVLTSARASNLGGSEKLFPKTAVPICSWDLGTLPQRDRYIAEFLVDHHMRHVSEDKEVRRILVDKLTSGMQGSAIWARMTLEDLATAGLLTSPGTVSFYLKEVELPKPLAELYLRVFQNVTGGNNACKWLLARSLELIAGARCRLTFDELLYALSLYTPPSTNKVSRAAKNLAELRDILHSQVGEERIRKLLRPFADLKPTIGFVHQSLKEAVLEFPALTDAAPPRQQEWPGVSGIEDVMLRTCVDYLMLEDFDWTETIPDDKVVRREIPQTLQSMCQDHQHTMSDDARHMVARMERDRGLSLSGNSLTEPPVSSNADSFGAFFCYATHYWRAHLGRAPDDFNLDDALELASPISARHQVWVLESSCWYPQCSPKVQPSPLCLLARFGNVPMLEQQLNRLAQNGVGDKRLIFAAATTAIWYGNLGHFRALMNHRSTAMNMETVESLEYFVSQLGFFPQITGRSDMPACL